MQLYILDRDPVKSAQLIPAKLGHNNYAQKMLIELCQCLCNLMGNKYTDERFYKYKAVPPEFTTFIFTNTMWVCDYASGLLNHCVNSYADFKQTNTYSNCKYIVNKFSGLAVIYKEPPSYAFFVPVKEYGNRRYLPIDECIKQYKQYLEWKINTHK